MYIQTSWGEHQTKNGQFLDLKKAFDTVNHQILIRKLANLNFSPDALNWMKSYLSGRIQCVRVGNETSPFLCNEMGVPQGSILGPILFSLYINDLPSVCTGCVIQMYADDTVLYAHAKTSVCEFTLTSVACLN